MKSLLDDFAAEVTQSTETLDEQKVTPLHLGYVGKAVKRKEDLPLITGTSCFVGDMSLPRQLHMRVVRSPVAHGKIIDIDASAALEAPGVVAVWTHHRSEERRVGKEGRQQAAAAWAEEQQQ